MVLSTLFWCTQVETGSAITWKYPSCILKGDGSVGEFYSVALTNNAQQADTGRQQFLPVLSFLPVILCVSYSFAGRVLDFSTCVSASGLGIAGTKMVHIGKNTRSRIVSKGISAGGSRNAYRGLVSVGLPICVGSCLLL